MWADELAPSPRTLGATKGFREGSNGADVCVGNSVMCQAEGMSGGNGVGGVVALWGLGVTDGRWTEG